MSRKKKIIYILIVIVVLVLGLHAAVFIVGMKTDSIGRWVDGQYFGEISEMGEDSFVLHGRSNGNKEIFITKKTVFKKGLNVSENNLQRGDRVMVFGIENNGGGIEAELIRIFEPNEKNRLKKIIPFPFSIEY